MELLDWINDELTILAEAFGETLTEQRQEIYCGGLSDIRKDHLRTAFRRARYELKWFPKLAELRELAGAVSGSVDDGRPGPEESWARMPKGERAESDSVVWCEEERAAYGACRSLLNDGDLIGARMAFKERYQKEVAAARAEGRPVAWAMSAGHDVQHRLSILADAIRERRMSLDTALSFVPGENRGAFAQTLPPAQAKGLLPGPVEKVTPIPGLPGVLARMQMEGTVPEELEARPRLRDQNFAERSANEVRALRERANAQIEFLKRSRDSTATTVANNAGSGAENGAGTSEA